ncbi:MAG TPA: MerR family transcriptional regulator [Bacteroidales bacterium]|jgi:DNA-binding transcriptional MerR regulator|nr:MerR family transcriptional regulator [Bacteroidales bacterium]
MPYKEKKVEKLYYSIGEVSEILDVPVSTVRFWDNEFDILKPMKNKKGNRLFTQNDMKNLKIIHHLLKEEGMTLSGVKKRLSGKFEETDYKYEVSQSLLKIRSMLLDIRDSM